MWWTKSRVNLDDIAIAAPCNAAWSAMTGSEQERVCAECKLSVFNLSALSRREAEDLLNQSKPGAFCIKLFRRADGTILTKDCPTGLRLLSRAKFKMRLAISTILAVFTSSPAKATYPDSQVERYGFYINTAAYDSFTRKSSHQVDKRIGEQVTRQADYSLANLFQGATEFERSNNTTAASDYYEAAIAMIRRDGQKFDPKFVELVVSKYAQFLRKNKRIDDAEKIEKELKAKTLYPPPQKNETEKESPKDNSWRSLMSF
jgi:hypothetical protein